MKFLVDAQLSYRLSEFLKKKGHESIHTLDLPKKNTSTDEEINRIILKEKRVLITKDERFCRFNSSSERPLQAPSYYYRKRVK
jgi:predicted nuclease of predicted toxin-antitoxin system